MSFQHFLKQCFEKKSKRCILPVLRQKSTQKVHCHSSDSKQQQRRAQNALVIQLQNYPKNIRRKYLLRWNFFLHLSYSLITQNILFNSNRNYSIVFLFFFMGLETVFTIFHHYSDRKIFQSFFPSL